METRRHTKIVATLGPSTDEPGMVDKLIAAGMDCARINCSYDGPDQWRSRVASVRAGADRRDLPVPVMFDLQGAKIRLAQATSQTHLERGTEVRLVGSGAATPADNGLTLAVDSDDFADMVQDDSVIVIGDGMPRLTVREHGDGAVVAAVEASGTIGPGKGVTVIDAHEHNDAAMTTKDAADLDVAVEVDAEFVAISYVHTAADVEETVERLRAAGSRARVIAKIEQVEAYEQLDAILDVSDGVMVARGDLGVAVGSERVPLIQKDIIRRATHKGKLVITATQMLESMVGSPEPTRAEAADIANAVIDGTSAVMLSAETSAGAYPLEAVTKMAAIAAVAESEEIRGASSDAFSEPRDEAVMHAALYLCVATGAEALVVPTTSGNTARSCAKYRPRKPIVAITDDAFVAAQMNLEWGVVSAAYTTEHEGFEYINVMLTQAKTLAGLDAGALVVMTAGPRVGRSGATNVIALHELP